MGRDLKVKPTDMIRVEPAARKELAKRFGVSLPTVNIALRGAVKGGNAPLIREAAMNGYQHYVVRV